MWLSFVDPCLWQRWLVLKEQEAAFLAETLKKTAPPDVVGLLHCKECSVCPSLCMRCLPTSVQATELPGLLDEREVKEAPQVLASVQGRQTARPAGLAVPREQYRNFRHFRDKSALGLCDFPFTETLLSCVSFVSVYNGPCDGSVIVVGVEFNKTLPPTRYTRSSTPPGVAVLCAWMCASRACFSVCVSPLCSRCPSRQSRMAAAAAQSAQRHATVADEAQHEGAAHEEEGAEAEGEFRPRSDRDHQELD